MKQIDFGKFRLYCDLGSDHCQTIDWRKELGNYLLARMGGVEGMDLALRVYQSDGPVELSDAEFERIKMLMGAAPEEGGVRAAYYYSFLKNGQEPKEK